MPDLDLQVFSAYCVAVGDLADVRAGWVLEGRPATVMRPSGQREHPTIQTLRTIGLDVLRYASALGLTPRSRKSLAVEIGAVETPPAAGKPRRPDPADKYFLDD
jgi:phage terminase small subunit